MPVDKLTCPHCEAVLRPSKPLEPGRKVSCPKCGTGFVVPGEEMDVLPAEPEAPPTPAASGLKQPYEEDDDSGPATYKFIDEPAPVRKTRDHDDDDDDYDDDDEDEEVDEREDLSIVPDLTVKDPRGIAQEMVMRPSNWLMLSAVLSIILELIVLSYFLIPIFFSIPVDTSLNTGPPAQKGKETAKAKDFTEHPTLGLATWLFVLLQALGCIIVIVYNGFIVYGTVRIQNLEGYGWGIAACILGMIPGFSCCWLLSVISAVVCLITLRNPQVIAGFEYQPE